MEERKINIDRAPTTSAEIASRKDFQNVLSGAKPFIKPPFYKSGWFTATVAGVAIVAATTVTSMMIHETEPEKKPIAETTSSEPMSAEVFDYDEDTPCLNPPVKELDIPYSTYVIDAEDGGTIVHPTGSALTIPKYAFVDADGNEVLGEIEIKYREFHDQVDILLSGIPMRYDSAGVNYNLESAGMMEILGYQNHEPVFIHPEKPIEVSMQSSNASPTFNIYDLDENSGEWTNIGKDKIIVQEPEDGTHYPTAQISLEEIMAAPDVIDGENRIRDLKKEVDIAKAEHNVAQNNLNAGQQLEPKKPRKVEPNNFSFDLAVKKDEFPEISVYKNMKWEVSPKDKTFSPDVFDLTWRDVEITEKVKGKTYNLKLTKGTDIRTFEVYPAFEGDNYNAALKVFDVKFNTYQKKHQMRIDMETRTRSIYQVKVQEWEDAKKEQAKLIAQYQTDILYTGGGEDNDKAKKQKLSVGTKITRVFMVLSFGIINSDRTIPAKPSGQRVAANFIDQHGDPILLSEVKLIQRSRNTVYNYPVTDFERLSWDPREDNVIVATSAAGRMGYVNSDYIKSIAKGTRKHTFQLKMLDAKNLSPQDLRRKLSL